MSATPEPETGRQPLSIFGAPMRAGDPIRWGLPHTAAAYVVGVVASAILFNLAGGREAARANTTATFVSTAGLWFGFLGGAWAATRWFGRRSMRDDFGLDARWSDVPAGVVFGAVTQLIVVPLVSWPVERIWHVDVSAPNQQLLDSKGSTWLLYLGVVVIAPIAEEVFFRGLLQRSLSRLYTDRVAIAVSALIFAASHFKPAQLPALFAVGVVFAALATHHRRLGPAIVAHVAFNAAAVVMLR